MALVQRLTGDDSAESDDPGERRLAGAIVGTAIYEGRVDVAEAVAVLA